MPVRWPRLCKIAHLAEKSRSRACARIDSRVASRRVLVARWSAPIASVHAQSLIFVEPSRRWGGYFLADFFALRIFMPPFAFDAAAPAIRKSSGFLPDLIAAASHRGFNPRPAQVSPGFSGLRYLGATAKFSLRPSDVCSRSIARR